MDVQSAMPNIYTNFLNELSSYAIIALLPQQSNSYDSSPKFNDNIIGRFAEQENLIPATNIFIFTLRKLILLQLLYCFDSSEK